MSRDEKIQLLKEAGWKRGSRTYNGTHKEYWYAPTLNPQSVKFETAWRNYRKAQGNVAT